MARRRRKNRKRKDRRSEEAVKGLNEEKLQDDTLVEETSVIDKTVDGSSSDTASEPSQTEADRVEETLDNVDSLLSEASEDADAQASEAESTDWAVTLEKSLKETQDHINQQFAQLTECFESQLSELRNSLSGSLNNTRQACQESETVDSDESSTASSKKPLSDWERRKREMYAEYGEALPEEVGDSVESEATADQDELASLQESLHDSIESLDGVEAEEIEDLRAQLTEKLREAEVELSINRAKLDQRRAELDRRQSELERKEKSLKNKYANVDGTPQPQKMGVLDRLTRHLGVRKQADSL